jgi:SnoaL-like domain
MPQIEQFTKELNLPGPIASYLRAVNTGSKEEFLSSFADDAVVVDVNRELSGLDAITAWAGADIFGAHVHFDVLSVTERQGRTIVTLEVDGTFDRAGLPDPLVMNHEFKVAEGKIAELRIGF